MDQHRLPALTRSLTHLPSRRAVLRGLAGAGYGLGVLLPDAVAARKKKKRKKKGKPNTPQPTCPAGTEIAVILVPAYGTTINTPVLAQGQRYRLRAFGFWATNAERGLDAFADFSLGNPTDAVTTFEGVRLGLTVDGGGVDQWGSYTTRHVYEREVIGQGAVLGLRSSDVVYTDNGGVVVVQIVCA